MPDTNSPKAICIVVDDESWQRIAFTKTAKK